MRYMSFPLSLFLICFCLITGSSPAQASRADTHKKAWRGLSGTKSNIYGAAHKILQLYGFEMEKEDAAEGVLNTASSPMRLNLEECDCGLGGGAPVKDARPIIHVSVAVSVDQNRISIRAAIDGDYPKDQISPKMIEDDLFDRIEQYLE